ncbi:MAG: hypothetical protein LBE23_05805 [Vagococcus sp.]|jgi:hypothetical protein|nr:hypothetical protein [Vagococcus sp.]
MKKYISYEEGCEGIYTEENLKKSYDEVVIKDEYPDYELWKYDMLRTKVFREII